jgi:erythromycin esterase
MTARLVALLLASLALPALAASPIRSIDPNDADFSDLAPLAAAIGNARVVQLGEATHGDGATFLAKARLIHFLHEVMGFDAIAWESGFVDVRLTATALRAGLPPPEAAERGLYATWQVREVMATLAYIQKSQMDLVGFDCRVARPQVRAERYPKLIFDFFDALDPALISKKERNDFVAMSKGLVPADYYAKPGLRDFNRALPARLVEVIDRRRAELLAHFAPREIDCVRQSLVSFMNMDRGLGRGDKAPFSEGYTRDAAMAANLLWWLNGPLRDRKVIVWAHNYHVMNDYVSEASSAAAKPGGAPMGWFLKRELGAQLYTIAFTSYGGTFRPMEGGEPPKIVPGALETMLHAEGAAQSFLDFAHLPPDHPLRKPVTASFYFHQPQSATWPRIYDGVLFIDAEKAATPE